MKEIFTTKEVSDILKISVSTVTRFLKNSKIHGFRHSPDSYWKVTRKELIKYMQEHNIPMEFLNGDKIKILIVDDEKDVVRTLIKILSKNEKYQIESADSGFIAGSKLEVFKPDIIILDIFLGDIDGRDFSKFIRNHPELSESKVIGMSGKLDKNEIKELLKKGFDEFLSKPFKIESLIDAVKKAAGK